MSDDIRPHFDPKPVTLESITARLAEERRARRLEHRSPNTLYIRPNLDFYHDQARRLHKAERVKDPSAKLHAAQFTVARSVGFPSWPRLAEAIRDRESRANELREAIRRGDHSVIVQIAREYPLAVLDAGCVASPDELGLLLKLVPMSRHDPDMLTALLDAVADHHQPEGLEECVSMLLNLGADPFHANDSIEERQALAAASPNGTQRVEAFENALGVLAWYVDAPEDDYMPELD